ncbi:MAG: class I SAM-dependent methyltransferase [Brumimicrobium sp.]|nr:class I SAM-dependent methyltransferase [Brumimicrobium sp.]
MIDKKEVTDFYNNFVDRQKKVGVSVRHRIIYSSLKNIGLKKDSKVLEVGCGIGQVSSLIIPSISSGQYVGTDISPKSIETARRTNLNKNTQFLVSDMSDFQHELKFDFIVFPDVLEHIPVEEHANLFKNIEKCSHPGTRVLINIPEPNALNWMRKNKPEALQVIDQSLSMQDLLNNVYPAGFQVYSIIPYSIHTNVNNYVSIVLVREAKINELTVQSKLFQLIQNLRVRFLGTRKI